jgi:hypothetical protein
MTENNSFNSVPLKTQPNTVPLILMIIGTCLLAIPSALGTWVLLLDDSSGNPGVRGNERMFLLILSLAGFGLLLGYFLTLIFRRYIFIFWLCSGLYNLALTCLSGYFVAIEVLPEIHGHYADLLWFLLFIGWLFFMTLASGYYTLRTISPRAQKLP